MNSYQFTINKKISTIKVGENKFKFAIDKSGATTKIGRASCRERV